MYRLALHIGNVPIPRYPLGHAGSVATTSIEAVVPGQWQVVEDEFQYYHVDDGKGVARTQSPFSGAHSLMIDLHCHMLPGIDDGAANLDTALEMARIAVSDGITMSACTPHIYPGLFENTGEQIKRNVQAFRGEIQEAGIPLEITYGADIQLVPEIVRGLNSGHMPTLHGTRYFLFEPPHHTVPAGFSQVIFDALASGYIPVITHPERLTWLDDEHYEWFADAARRGAWIQLTAGAVTGRFGQRPKYWSERFLDDGLVHILATDAHDPKRRPPLLAEGYAAAERWVGGEEAGLLVTGRTRAVLENREPANIPPPPALCPNAKQEIVSRSHKGWLGRLFSSD